MLLLLLLAVGGVSVYLFVLRGDVAPEQASASGTTTAGSTSSDDTGGSGTELVFTSKKISPAIRKRIEGKSWHTGCPIGLKVLRYVRIPHWNFNGKTELGEMIVNTKVVKDVKAIFAELYKRKYPIASMRLVDEYHKNGAYADDWTSIEANNTSAFNCRAVTGGTGWSKHSFGRAIDINPIQNPYILNGSVSHKASEQYIARKKGPGVLIAGDAFVRAFTSRGWGWGGDWANPTDLQHFYKDR